MWNPNLVSIGTKKLHTPRAMRTTPNISPSAVARSEVGNDSALQSMKNACGPNPAPSPPSTT